MLRKKQLLTFWINKNLNTLIESVLFSFILIYISSAFRIVNPKSVDWLTFGDGTAEISWEFFRKQPLIQFPLGVNPKYGLEISSTAALDGQIPLMSFIFHPFTNLLPGRFQYYGLFILLTFAVNYYFAKKIFIFCGLNSYQSVVSGLTLACSPVILNRYIENTHYALTSAWIIFAAIFLSINKSIKLSSWMLLLAFTLLIHLYYLPFVFIMYFFTYIFMIYEKKFSIKTLIPPFMLISASIFFMSVIGYFYKGISGRDVGYGLFRSTLISLFDSSGWSRVLPDLAEPDGSYEGFAFIGIATFILIFVNLILIRLPKVINNKIDFKPLWISAIILFIFSLSNKVALGKLELFDFNVPYGFSIITNTFRSTGRFTWLLVFILFIYLVYSISKRIRGKSLSIILTFICLINFIDTFQQLTSQRSSKFKIDVKSSLTSSAWSSISTCYENLRVYPPTVEVENYYSFLEIASEQNLGINTGRFGRVNQSAILGAYDLMHKEFNTGVYRTDSLYVFTNAGGLLPEIVNYQRNLAIHTLNEESAYGELDGYTFIAPNLKNCPGGNALKKASTGFGPPETQKYRGEKLTFGEGFDTSKYILSGFSALEAWGVWSLDEYSKINLNTENISNYNFINITARDFTSPANIFTLFINDLEIGNCSFEIEFSTCSLPFEFNNLQTNNVNISFLPKSIRSPKDLRISDDTRNLGFGLKNISFS